MSDERFTLSRRKALAALGTVGVASAGAGLGTSAYFSDQETFENNRLTAGELDLKVGWQESYSDWSEDESDGLSTDPRMSRPTEGDYVGFPAGAPTAQKLLWVERNDTAPFIRNTSADAYPDPNDNGVLGPTRSDDPCVVLADTPEDLDPTTGDRTDSDDTYDPDAPEGERVRPLISIDDVKPGDFGQVVFPFALCDNPGYVWLTGRLVEARENGQTEPEADDDEGGPADEVSTDVDNAVELLDEVQVALYYTDSLGDYAEDRVTTFRTGSLREVLRDLSSGSGIPLSGNISAETGGGTGRDCFSGVNDGPPFHFVGLSWYLPVDHANEIQSDSVSFDLGFYTEQCRHNDGAGLPPDVAQVRIDDQESDGTSVTVQSVGLPDDGYVVIHDERLQQGQPLASVIGVSGYLEAGFHSDVTVDLFTGVPGATFSESSLDDGDLVIAMPHEETGGDQSYDFVVSGAAEDPPFFDEGGSPVTDPATVTVD